jgi:curved DNA-binding protein CbpA
MDMHGEVDPFALLGVSRGADTRTIKRAYRRLAKKHHPDVNPGDPQAEQRFKQIQWAYDTILKSWGTGHGHGPAPRPNSAAGVGFAPVDDEHPFFGFYAALREYWLKNKF